MNKIVKALTIGTVATVGVSAVVYHEVIDRSGKVMRKLADIGDKKAFELNPVVDPRQIWFEEQVFEEYTMVGENNNSLRGYLLRAEKPTDKYVFCSHGYRCYAKREFRFIGKFLHEQGYNIFMVDHCSSGESDGKHIGFGYFEHKDCMKWLNFMLDTFGKDIKIFLYGISMGSATVMLMSGDEQLPDNVKFTVADCGYTSAYHEFEHVIRQLGVAKYPIINLANQMCKTRAGYDFKNTDALTAVKHTQVPILFIHGKADDFVPTFMGEQLYNACTSTDKELLLIDGAGHAASYQTDSESYEKTLSAFADKHFN